MLRVTLYVPFSIIMSATLTDLTPNQTEDMVVALSTLICHDAGIEVNVRCVADPTNGRPPLFSDLFSVALFSGKKPL